MFVHSNDIYGTSQQLFEEAFQTNQKIGFWLHFHTYVHFTVFVLFVARNRTKQS